MPVCPVQNVIGLIQKRVNGCGIVCFGFLRQEVCVDTGGKQRNSEVGDLQF